MKHLTFFLLLCCIIQQVHSQVCDEKIRDLGKELGQLGYQPRDQQTRCEGLYYDQVSGVSIDLVSLTVGPLRYRLRADEVINIKCASDSKQSSVMIRGTSFRSRPKYRLDMALSVTKNSSIKLMVKEVLNESRISNTDLGLFGYINRNNSVIYFPVTVTSKYYSTPESDKIYVTFLSNVETSQVVYKLAESKDDICGPFTPEIKMGTGYEKMEPIIIEIDRSQRRKELCLEVLTLPAGTTKWERRSFRIHVPT